MPPLYEEHKDILNKSYRCRRIYGTLRYSERVRDQMTFKKVIEAPLFVVLSVGKKILD